MRKAEPNWRSLGLVVGALVAFAPDAFAGPIGLLYTTYTDTQSGNSPVYRILQGTSVVGGWEQSGPQPTTQQTALAVNGAIVGVTGVCSGVCPQPYAATYTLAGGYLGSDYLDTFPIVDGLDSTFVTFPEVEGISTTLDYLYDGTTDGTDNFAVGAQTGTVYRFDSGWQNGEELFSLPDPTLHLWLGITYDPSDNSLWLSSHLTETVLHTAMNGDVLGSFTMSYDYNLAQGLAFDPADQSLWVARFCTNPSGVCGGTNYLGNRLEQYSRTGEFMGSVIYNDLAGYGSIIGMEFDMASASAVPEPSTLMLFGAGLLAATVHKTRRRPRS